VNWRTWQGGLRPRRRRYFDTSWARLTHHHGERARRARLGRRRHRSGSKHAGQPASMLIPPVVGLRIVGETREGVTATDVVLTSPNCFVAKAFVGKFVEPSDRGEGLSVETRAPLATCRRVWRHLHDLSDRPSHSRLSPSLVARPRNSPWSKAYAKAQGVWHARTRARAHLLRVRGVDLATVEPSLAGPKLLKTAFSLSGARGASATPLGASPSKFRGVAPRSPARRRRRGGRITSCQTREPVGVDCGRLVAKKAIERGLARKPLVKTSLVREVACHRLLELRDS